MSLANESIWISGRAGEQRFCGGCHENRTKAATLAPGIPTNVLTGAVNLVLPRAQRVDTDGLRADGRQPDQANPLLASDKACAAFPGTWRSSRSSTPSARAATTATTERRRNPSYTITDNDHGHDADVHLRPPRPEGERDGRRARDG